MKLLTSRWMTAAALVAPLLMTTSALAGPTWKFGDDGDRLLKLNYAGQTQLVFRDTGAGPDGTDSAAEFNLRRNRLQLIGAAGDWLGFYLQTEFLEDRNITPLTVGDGDTSSFEVLDVVVRIKADDAFQLRLGKFKYNFTRENLEDCFGALNSDRSLFVRAPLGDDGTRDKGLAIWGNLADDLLQYRLDVMNGRNDSASTPSSAFRYSARVHVSLFEHEADYGYKGSYLGQKTVLTLGGAVQYEASVAYADVARQADAKDYLAWTVDLFGEFPTSAGTFTFSAAYADYKIGDAYEGADPDPEVIGLNGQKNGGHAKLAYMLPTLPLQLFARGELWRFARLDGVNDQGVTYVGGGANYYFDGQSLRLTVEAFLTDFEHEGTFGTHDVHDFTTVLTQLQFVY